MRIFRKSLYRALFVANRLAVCLESLGRYEEAEALQQRVVKSLEQSKGPAHSDTLKAMNGLSGVLTQRGRHAEAEALLRRALAAQVEAGTS